MTESARARQQDWTLGPAKWAAVLLLGASSLGGMVFTLGRGAPPPSVAHSVERAAATHAGSPTAVKGATDAPEHAAAAPKETRARRININTAGLADLELLPGVGPAMAKRIIDYRAAHGAFRRVDDLDGVKGIGPRTLEKLRPLVGVE